MRTMVENGNIPSVNSSHASMIQGMEQKKYKTASVESTENAPQSDKATVSVEAQVLSKSIAALNDVDDVRQDKVDAIKQKIDTGTYEIKYENIASKIGNILKQISE
jgi:negative regulator of flagellin synthesis FlgM